MEENEGRQKVKMEDEEKRWKEEKRRRKTEG